MTADFRTHPDRHCRGRHDVPWFPPVGSTSRLAKSICAGCPVIEVCRAWGIAHELHGIWGATSPRERRNIRRQLGITVDSPETVGHIHDRGAA